MASMRRRLGRPAPSPMARNGAAAKRRRTESANVQRANIVICVATMITVVTVALAIGGDISAAAFLRAIVIGVVYLLGAWAGGWLFEKTPASWFRPAVLWILVATGIGVLIV